MSIKLWIIAFDPDYNLGWQFRPGIPQARILGLHRCCWRMLKTKCVCDKFRMLVKKHQPRISATIITVWGIMMLLIDRNVINIMMSPISLSPTMIHDDYLRIPKIICQLEGVRARKINTEVKWSFKARIVYYWNDRIDQPRMILYEPKIEPIQTNSKYQK